VTISEQDLTQIADDICASLIPPDAIVGQLRADPADGPVRTMTAVVDISGDWNGSVSVSCQRDTAVDIASVMFDAPGPELSVNDIVDALGEFANMAGGSVKAMLEGDKTLGLPTVGEGTDFIMMVPHTRELLSVDYEVATGGTLHLAVHQLED
jgi:chemotaxis protein CheX